MNKESTLLKAPASSFDLVTVPWIPVLRPDGSRVQLGLLEALLQAQDISAVSDPMPTVEFGIYRILVAILIDAFRLDTDRKLNRVISNAKFDGEIVQTYFDKHKSLFNLFDEKRPFLQTPGMGTKDAKPLAGLIPAIPSGTAALHFHRFNEAEFGVSPAVAARFLTTISPFMTAGGAGLSPSINGAPPWYLLILGDSLFETLTRNIYIMSDQAKPLGEPAWRRTTPFITDRCKDYTFLEALTWQPRQIQLIPGEGGRCAVSDEYSDTLVRSMQFKKGSSCDFDDWYDPNVAYKTAEKRNPLRPSEGKAVWRDIAPLALLHDKIHSGNDKKAAVRFDRPRIIGQYASLEKDEIHPKGEMLQLKVYGKRTDMKMKVFEWFAESLAVPFDLIWNNRFHGVVQDQMDLAGTMAYHLKRCLKQAFHGVDSGRGAAAEQLFWNELRPYYDALLRSLAAIHIEGADVDDDLAKVLYTWKGALHGVTLHEFDQTADIADVSASGRYLLSASAARADLKRIVTKLLGYYPASTPK